MCRTFHKFTTQLKIEFEKNGTISLLRLGGREDTKKKRLSSNVWQALNYFNSKAFIFQK